MITLLSLTITNTGNFSSKSNKFSSRIFCRVVIRIIMKMAKEHGNAGTFASCRAVLGTFIDGSISTSSFLCSCNLPYSLDGHSCVPVSCFQVTIHHLFVRSFSLLRIELMFMKDCLVLVFCCLSVFIFETLQFWQI